MISILSATDDHFYSYPLPIVVWTWNRIGIDVIVLIPDEESGKIELAKKYCSKNTKFRTFNVEDKKKATYSQVSRLFGATVFDGDELELIIVGDADLAVFGDDFSFLDPNKINILGGDLLSEEMNQYPMCFISMSAKKWRDVFELKNKSLQKSLDDTVGVLESINFRGDFWGYDQWFAHKKIKESGEIVNIINRAKMPERFALRRCDRDNVYWRDDLNKNIIDAHLWRPAYTDENHSKIIELLQFMYPEENFDWVNIYRNEYLKLI